jgi:hypothetical protein
LSTSFEGANTNKKDLYDVAIDKAIIDILRNDETKSSRKLKENVEHKIGRTISSSTFSTHLFNLIEQKLIEKNDLGRGNIVNYSLTSSAKKKIELGLLGGNEERTERFRRIYNAIFFFHVFYYFPKILYSDYELKQVLTKLGVKEHELNWGIISYGHDDSPEIVYGRTEYQSIRQPLSGHKKRVAEYWKDRPGLSSVLAEIKFLCYPCKNTLEIFMERIEYWEINKKSENKKYLTEYHFHLSGFSINDIVNVTGEDFDAVNEAFNKLKKLDLIGAIINFEGESKYRFNDKMLEDLFAALWQIHDGTELWLLLKKWSYFDKPTADELKRLERLLGKIESERIKKLCDRTRSSTIVALRRSKTIYELMKHLVENREIPFLNVSSTIIRADKEYALYLKENEPVKYEEEISPEMQEWCFNYEERLLEEYKDDPFFDRALKKFRETRRRETTELSQKKKVQEVKDFYNILRSMEYEYLNYLPNQPGYEGGFEEIKAEFSDTISRYSFLVDLMKDVCPRILEPLDEESQQIMEENELQARTRARMTELIYVVKVRRNRKMISTEIKDPAEINKFIELLKQNKVLYHYDESKIYNEITQKLEERHIFTLLDKELLRRRKFRVFHRFTKTYNPATHKVEEVPVLDL